MGKWAQYRYRGRGASSAASEFPLAPPGPDDFSLASASLRVDISQNDGCPEGADGWDWQRSMSPSGPWTDQPSEISFDCGAGTNLVDPCIADDPWFARTRWTLSNLPVSDWSEPYSTTCSI